MYISPTKTQGFMKTSKVLLKLILLLFTTALFSQNYYDEFAPFDEKIPSPETFLGYKIGVQHTRHDQIVAYFKELAQLSDRVTLTEYGKTHENRSLLILNISSANNILNLNEIKNKHLDIVDPKNDLNNHKDLPLFINLAYSVHGNEASTSEAAILTAYTLVASKNKTILNYLDNAVFFIDPTINPDGRDRHTQWVNSRKSKNLVADPLDFEHTESWPSGRTNHYWFDLNRDWLLAVHPESQSKLKWFHEWYPNIVTDFHEMGSPNNTYFFEPKKRSGLAIPIVPKENAKLNTIFAKEFATSFENVGTFYFNEELFDGTYPGYGSTYGDLQGALALLFEQTATRGHLKKMSIGTLSFPEAITNQYISSITTIKTAIKNKDKLYDYQQNFFKNILDEAHKSHIKSYIFGDDSDKNRTNEFVKLLLRHKIKVYQSKENKYIVPTEQNQYKMVQSIFETHDNYRDSVFYDASAWSVVNFYNMPYAESKSFTNTSREVNLDNLYQKNNKTSRANYAYLIPWTDYYAPSFLYALQKAGIKVMALSESLAVKKDNSKETFGKGSFLIPISLQSISENAIFSIIKENAQKFDIPVTAINAGENGTGINLGSRSLLNLKKPKVLLWVGNGVSPYEAGEVWHLLDTRLDMALSKIALRNFNRVNLNNYNTMLMVSGSYQQLDSIKQKKIQNWVAQGNTLITSRGASAWAIKKKLVNEQLLKSEEDTVSKSRKNYADAANNSGKNQVGGAIFKIDLDLTHPIGYGYTRRTLPVYRSSSVWLKPSKNNYSTVAKYTKDAHIDGYISDKNYELLLKSASIIVSPIGKGRVVLFADNPNFRGAWYGTNKLFLNAIFFGDQIRVPR